MISVGIKAWNVFEGFSYLEVIELVQHHESRWR